MNPMSKRYAMSRHFLKSKKKSHKEKRIQNKKPSDTLPNNRTPGLSSGDGSRGNTKPTISGRIGGVVSRVSWALTWRCSGGDDGREVAVDLGAEGKSVLHVTARKHAMACTQGKGMAVFLVFLLCERNVFLFFPCFFST